MAGSVRPRGTTLAPGDRNTPSCLMRVRAYTLFPMPYFEFLWTNENTAHIAEHGVSQADFEAVVLHSVNRGISRRSLLPVAWGYTTDGRYIMAVYDPIDAVTVYPVTAYEVPEPR